MCKFLKANISREIVTHVRHTFHTRFSLRAAKQHAEFKKTENLFEIFFKNFNNNIYCIFEAREKN